MFGEGNVSGIPVARPCLLAFRSGSGAAWEIAHSFGALCILAEAGNQIWTDLATPII